MVEYLEWKYPFGHEIDGQGSASGGRLEAAALTTEQERCCAGEPGHHQNAETDINNRGEIRSHSDQSLMELLDHSRGAVTGPWILDQEV